MTRRRKSLFSNTLVLPVQGAVLKYAQLQGAALWVTQLQGAELVGAQLQGASLDDAQLQGASLDDAQLQGASFKDAALVATDVSSAEIWRANFFDAHLDKVFGDGLRETAMSKQDFVKLKGDITKSLPENDSRERVLKHIEVLNPDNTSDKAFGHSVLYAAKADEPGICNSPKTTKQKNKLYRNSRLPEITTPHPACRLAVAPQYPRWFMTGCPETCATRPQYHQHRASLVIFS